MDLVSFLSRMTGKTFPWPYWSPFDEFFKKKKMKKLKKFVKTQHVFQEKPFHGPPGVT